MFLFPIKNQACTTFFKPSMLYYSTQLILTNKCVISCGFRSRQLGLWKL